eukprot:CAMPEP_0194271638 /NCGR_PEP_ID=MMETSP0169-20130528/5377_1 /TAXON_ID=218684 /ORGANISM="Corethron pennatum, Strain L29A3" /LENGTH=190 /DNA_ID=CAMNT_0039014035 /DNA_START=30 /DNA_END=602 /DNA_ORIENTATION=-
MKFIAARDGICAFSFTASRRAILSSAAAPFLIAVSPDRSYGQDLPGLVAKGVVTVRKGDEAPGEPSAALYITCRPDTIDDVPRAILDGSRGKPPPVASARFAAPLDFPFRFEIDTSNLTPEGAADSEGGERWWKDKNMVVSARFDSDGVAATRDPGDLVGRSIYKSGGSEASVELQGRGIGGKFATKKTQ